MRIPPKDTPLTNTRLSSRLLEIYLEALHTRLMRVASVYILVLLPIKDAPEVRRYLSYETSINMQLFVADSSSSPLRWFQDRFYSVSSMEKPSRPLTPESPLTTENPFSDLELQAERQAVRKLDYTILPIVTLFYIVSFMVCFLWLRALSFFLIILQDRSNIGENTPLLWSTAD